MAEAVEAAEGIGDTIFRRKDDAALEFVNKAGLTGHAKLGREVSVDVGYYVQGDGDI